MSAREPDEAELRAALEAELERISVADVLIQTVVTLVNLAGRRLGLAPAGEGRRDLTQAHDAIEAVRALLPLVEAREGERLGPVRDALAQLQLEYARLATATGPEPRPDKGEPPAPGDAEPQATEPPGEAPQGPGPAQSSGRLWVPGQ